jgi:hypothetical protein
MSTQCDPAHDLTVGLVWATGRFHHAWLLRFLGLESFPICRADGRLEHYRGHPRLSDSAFAIVRLVVWQAAQNLSQVEVDDQSAWDPADRAVWSTALARAGLEGIASETGPSLVREIVREEKARQTTRALAMGMPDGVNVV